VGCIPLGKALSWGGVLEATWLRIICSMVVVSPSLPVTQSHSEFFVVIKSGGD